MNMTEFVRIEMIFDGIEKMETWKILYDKVCMDRSNAMRLDLSSG